MYEHINSHQNEHIEDKNLAWKAILIWEANILASTYLVETSPHYLQPISAAKTPSHHDQQHYYQQQLPLTTTLPCTTSSILEIPK